MELNGKDAKSFDKVIHELQERAGHNFFLLFKTITSDNGSDFLRLHEAVEDVADVYFSHLYA